MKKLIIVFFFLIAYPLFSQPGLHINDQGYFEMPGLDVIVFSDYYPEGHQTGVTVIQHGNRVAANGDLRLEISPGQWSPVPKGGKRTIDLATSTITQTLWYPDSSKNGKGFNPVFYPDLTFTYQVKVTAIRENAFRVTVDLDKPLPEEWIGKVGFNFELFPGNLFGKAYLMDGESGTFPLQPNGPVRDYFGEYLSDPLAMGSELIIAPEEDYQRMKIASMKTPLELWDGRTNYNNGWYIVRSMIPSNATQGAIEWEITPNVVEGWLYKPVIQVSQLGYHPEQPKIVVIEGDPSDHVIEELSIYKLSENGPELIKTGTPVKWGEFLRYQYLTYDFSEVKEPGMYQIRYGKSESNPFKISENVYERHAWQPTLDYYLPVQMCHMRINEKYRVWHGACHLDDALMAKVDTTLFDGYRQGPSTLTHYKPLEPVPELDRGGWHDAGDYDLRVESQIGTVWMLALMIEEFGLDYDATTIDQTKRIVEIHVPDGKSDALQQIEHGLLTVLGGYRSMGRLYRGIICSHIRQYVLLGDGSTMTDNLVYEAGLSSDQVENNRSGKMDDRWVFTEENPRRELYVSAGLAAASRVLKSSNPDLASECLETALALWENNKDKDLPASSRAIALSELILTTDSPELIQELVDMKDNIIGEIRRCGWEIGHVIHKIDDKKFVREIGEAVADYQQNLRSNAKESPFGVPYRPNIWGAGWIIQRFGVEQYFFYKGWPELTGTDFFVNALNFVLGVHPGINTSSFASGVGSESVTVAYGVNRAEWSYIPGGVVSGTALIRPDLPELKIWPYFWQQTEYVMGGGATNYMFLVMATDHLFRK